VLHHGQVRVINDKRISPLTFKKTILKLIQTLISNNDNLIQVVSTYFIHFITIQTKLGVDGFSSIQVVCKNDESKRYTPFITVAPQTIIIMSYMYTICLNKFIPIAIKNFNSTLLSGSPT
jgi:hypothetical protein